MSKVYVLFMSILIYVFNVLSIGECREVVFVLNAGQSMNVSDPFHIASESIVWATQNLAEDDEVAIVTFQNDANIIRTLSKVGNNPTPNFSVNYYNSSNAGAGLLTAIDMLSPKFNTQRDIIFITNGDFNNAQSAENFKAGLKQASWLGIPVYLIDLRYNVNPQNYREYEGVKFLPINYNELLTTIRTILQGDWHLPHISLPTNNLTSGTLKFELPVTSAKHLKISLFSSKTGTAQLKYIQSDNIFQGHFVKIFNINTPTSTEFEIAADYPQGSGLTLDVVPTVAGTLQTKPGTKFLIKDILEITPVYANNPDTKILSDTFFEGKKINLLVNDKNVAGEIQNGTIQLPLDDLDENISLQKIYFEDVGIIFDGDDTARLVVPKNHYGAILLSLIGLLIIGGLSWRINRKKYSYAKANPFITQEKTLPPVESYSKLVKSSNAEFNGKLVLYATKIPDDEDFAPREFNLFRMNFEKIPMSYVLEKCGIFKMFPNAVDIFISPNGNGISIDNQSDCTITKRNNIISKGAHVDIYYDDSINIASKDETAELIMVYKSLKPN